ncbi:hypothetical protein MNV49_001883 [Pseudohyphozyma bogoriensis]|nr:hypothetical protein MNV49_001883 [Pseudohyphozyma bogoriensis]
MDPNKPPPGSSELPFTTPLLGSRTLHSVASTSRLPALGGARSSTGSDGQAPATASRLRSSLSGAGAAGAATAIPSTTSRLATRKASFSGSSGIPAPTFGTATRPTTLKRTSSTAGLQASDTELSSTKRALSRALHDLEEQKHELSRQQLEHDASRNALNAQLQDALSKVEKLERQRGMLMAKEKEVEERVKSVEGDAERKIEDVKRSLGGLRGELEEAKGENVDLRTRVRELEHEVGKEKAKAGSEAEAVEALEAELERLSEEAGERRKELEREREARLGAEAKLGEVRQDEGERETVKIVREELTRQVTQLKALEKENSKLARRVETYEKDHAVVEVLKEEKKKLEAQVRSMDALRQQAAAFEGELEAMKREKSEWQSFLGPSDSAEFSSPRKMSKTLAATRIESASYRERLDTQELEIQRRDRMIGELENRTAALEKEVEASKALVGKAEARAKQEDSRQRLLKQEIDMLKSHLDTYAAEEAMQQGESNFDAQKAARLAELEDLLDAHKKEVVDLAVQVSHWRGLVERYGGSTTEILAKENEAGEDDTGVIVGKSLEEQLRRNETLSEELNQLRNTNSLLQKEIDSLELQVGRLTYEHGNGAYDPRTTKVLQLAQNPDSIEHAIRSSTLERLRDENQALLRTLAELEQRKEGSAGATGAVAMVPRASLVNMQAELDAANAVVQQKETMELRLKKAFSDKADEFRKAVQSLLGYRLDFLSSGRVKVTSVYAESKDHSLLFASASGGVGTMEFSGAGGNTEVEDEIKQLVKYWVAERGCIPGFLASATLTWFDQGDGKKRAR